MEQQAAAVKRGTTVTPVIHPGPTPSLKRPQWSGRLEGAAMVFTCVLSVCLWVAGIMACLNGTTMDFWHQPRIALASLGPWLGTFGTAKKNPDLLVKEAPVPQVVPAEPQAPRNHSVPAQDRVFAKVASMHLKGIADAGDPAAVAGPRCFLRHVQLLQAADGVLHLSLAIHRERGVKQTLEAQVAVRAEFIDENFQPVTIPFFPRGTQVAVSMLPEDGVPFPIRIQNFNQYELQSAVHEPMKGSLKSVRIALFDAGQVLREEFVLE